MLMNIRISDDHRRMLEEVAAAEGLDKSAAIRRMIEQKHAHLQRKADVTSPAAPTRLDPARETRPPAAARDFSKAAQVGGRRGRA